MTKESLSFDEIRVANLKKFKMLPDPDQFLQKETVTEEAPTTPVFPYETGQGAPRVKEPFAYPYDTPRRIVQDITDILLNDKD